MEKMKFDITPDPKVLIALTNTPMKPMDALCELIDNSIDSFHAARVQGVELNSPLINITLPKQKDVNEGLGRLKVQDNGPGMTPEVAEKSIKAGFSNNNPYDTLGLFGMGFNISTGKIGNSTTLMTARANSSKFIKTTINLKKINEEKDYNIDVEECDKGIGSPFEGIQSHGTVILVEDWWPEGTPNSGFVLKLVRIGLPKIREEIGRRYATILNKKEVRIAINGENCEPFEHCRWGDNRYVTRNDEKVPAYMKLDKVVGHSKRCGSCTAVVRGDDATCPNCGSSVIREIDERVHGWIGIQRYDDAVDFGVDLIRNGRAIRIGEKSAFFEYRDELNNVVKDYPIDGPYGRIIGEIHLDFVPVDFSKQDFQRSTEEWSRAMSYIRGDSSLQPNQPRSEPNDSPMYKLFQGYRRVRNIGRGDMYMGYWDPDTNKPHRISRDVEAEYLEKFKQKLPGYHEDTEWWKLVESANQPPVEELPECPDCHAQNLREADVCTACGFILKGKECLDKNCKAWIPQSAKTCPVCGTSQIMQPKEPWKCEVCGTSNTSMDELCRTCGKPKGTPNPLSEEYLLAQSNKVDELSSNALSIVLADGNRCSTMKVSVYSVRDHIVSPISMKREPIIVEKNLDDISIFVDFSHEYFTSCGLTKEQVIASEVAQYIYEHNRSSMKYKEYNLSTITWAVMQEMWKDSIVINEETVLKEVKDLLKDIVNGFKIVLGRDAAQYCDELTEHEKSIMVHSMMDKGVDPLDTSLKESGRYLDFVPYSFFLRVYNEEPDKFFNGSVWKDNLSASGSNLGADIVRQIRNRIVTKYGNCLQDVVFFHENRYSDPLTLRRVKLSIEVLRKGMAE